MFGAVTKLIISISIVLCILFIFCGFAYYNGAFILSRILSGKLGTKVLIEEVNFKSNEIEILETKIKNPRKTTVPFALSIGSINLKAPYQNYFKTNIYLNELNLDDVHLVVELFSNQSKDSNWNHIMNDLDHSPQAKVESKSKRNALIKSLSIKNFTVEVIIPGTKSITLYKDDLYFSNVRTDDGEIVRRIIVIILLDLLSDIQEFMDPLKIRKYMDLEEPKNPIPEGLEDLLPF